MNVTLDSLHGYRTDWSIVAIKYSCLSAVCQNCTVVLFQNLFVFTHTLFCFAQRITQFFCQCQLVLNAMNGCASHKHSGRQAKWKGVTMQGWLLCFPRPKSLSFYQNGRLSDVNAPGKIGKEYSCRMYKSLPSQSPVCLKSCTCMCATREIDRSLQVHAIF